MLDEVFLEWISCLIDIIVMKSEFKYQNSRDFIKVRFESEETNKSKFICCKDLGYHQFIEKLIVSLDLPKQKYYKLFYIDHSQDQILLNEQQDYQNFTQNMEQMVLYLRQTPDQNIDFRKNIQEEVQAKRQELNKIIQTMQQFKKKLDESTVNKQVKLINQKTESIKSQIQEFKKGLAKRTAKNLEEKLKQIQQRIDNSPQNTSSNFKHSMNCQSSIQCSFKNKKIQGVRFRCIVCSDDFCYRCSEQEFRAKNCIHDPTHPTIKIKDDKWENKLQQIAQQPNLAEEESRLSLNRFPRPIRSNSEQQKIITQLASLLTWSYQQARKFRQRYPNLTLQQLLNKAFS